MGSEKPIHLNMRKQFYKCMFENDLRKVRKLI